MGGIQPSVLVMFALASAGCAALNDYDRFAVRDGSATVDGATMDASRPDAGPDASRPDAGPDASADVDAGLPCMLDGDCGDSNPCTIDRCIANVCNYGFQGMGFGCDDGVFCNGPDTCAGDEECLHAGDPCPGGVGCDEDRDWCTCDDGNLCTGTDHRDGGGNCVGTALGPYDPPCGRCDDTLCRRCCSGVCQTVSDYDDCAGCGGCSGAQRCEYSSGSACGHLWCCAGTP